MIASAIWISVISYEMMVTLRKLKTCEIFAPPITSFL